MWGPKVGAKVGAKSGGIPEMKGLRTTQKPS